MKRIENIVYGNLDSANKLNLYLPDDATSSAFVYFHGGGLEHGDKKSADVFAPYLTSRAIAVVSANYRMYPNAAYPDFICDAAEAVAWANRYMKEEIGCDKLGSFRDLEKVLDKHQPTDVVFAIDSYNKRHLIKLVNLCDDRCIKVYFLPVIYGFFKSEKQLEQVGNLPLINIHTTPLDNRANAFLKRIIEF